MKTISKAVAANKTAAKTAGKVATTTKAAPLTKRLPAAKVAPVKEQEEIVEYLKKVPMVNRATRGRSTTSQPTYRVAECNYNNWREWGKYIANGLARTTKNGEVIEMGYVDGPVIARHVQNRNLADMQNIEGVQAYGGFVVATEENIPAVVKNIEDFYADPINAGVKNFFNILPEFPATHQEETPAPQAAVTASKKSGSAKQKLLALINEM